MVPLKALGPDGMPPLFYQHFWSTVDKDVTSSILSWLNSGTLPHPINHTFITLILKTDNPEYVYQFRPISLCNVLYKIFSKVLANRLKKVLPDIIIEHQSAFTKDRLISNNILVAFETLHCMQRYNLGTPEFMALKLDMSKSYDPLSPFLFLLCTEGLNGLIKQVKVNGDIHGFSLCRRGPKLTHLLFANDSLLFCRAIVEECGHVLDILKNYEETLGQKVNRDKTSLFFSKSVPNETKSSIKQAL